MKFPIALAQLHIQFGDLQTNLRRSANLISEAARRASRMVLLPELWSCGYDLPTCCSEHAAATPEIIRELSTSQKHVPGHRRFVARKHPSGYL